MSGFPALRDSDYPLVHAWSGVGHVLDGVGVEFEPSRNPVRHRHFDDSISGTHRMFHLTVEARALKTGVVT